jgi:hypothetical protein
MIGSTPFKRSLTSQLDETDLFAKAPTRWLLRSVVVQNDVGQTDCYIGAFYKNVAAQAVIARKR